MDHCCCYCCRPTIEWCGNIPSRISVGGLDMDIWICGLVSIPVYTAFVVAAFVAVFVVYSHW